MKKNLKRLFLSIAMGGMLISGVTSLEAGTRDRRKKTKVHAHYTIESNNDAAGAMATVVLTAALCYGTLLVGAYTPKTRTVTDFYTRRYGLFGSYLEHNICYGPYDYTPFQYFARWLVRGL